jgi:hypothetical protein
VCYLDFIRSLGKTYIYIYVESAFSKEQIKRLHRALLGVY